MKAIAIGDIHIANRRLHNLDGDPLFRLRQFGRVAVRLVEYIRQEGIEEVWILGDLVDTAVLQPEEAHAVHDFITTILTTGVKIKFILGNHDVSSKAETDDSAARSLVPLLIDYPNVAYMHRQVEEIEGVTFAWCNWQPNFKNVDWFDHADVFLSHVNILEGRFGQDLDESRFDFGLCGDIHMKCKRGKTHSTGAIIQSNAGDAPDGSFVRLDIADGKYEWSYVDTAVPGIHDFLRVYREDKMPDDYEEREYDVVVSVKKPEATRDLSDEQVEALFDSEATLASALEAETSQVAKMIDDVLKSVQSRDLQLSTLRFVGLDIVNFRCISELTLDLEDLDKLNRINGPVGKGKSSIVRAMDYVIAGKGSPKALVRYGSDTMSVSLSFVYQGIAHEVEKSGQYISRWVREGRVMEAGSKKELQELFMQDNPWTVAWPLMYHDQHSAGFLIGMNLTDRVSFLSKLLGFDGLIETNTILRDKLKAATKEMNERKAAAAAAKAVLESKQGEITSTEDEVRADIAKLQEVVSVLKGKLQRAVEERSEVVAQIEKRDLLTKAQSRRETAMAKLKMAEKPAEQKTDTAADMALLDRYNKLRTINDLLKIKADGVAAREEIENPPNQCSECGGSLEVPEEWIKSKKEALDRLYDLYAEVDAEQELRASLKDEAHEARRRMNSMQEEKEKAVAYARAEQEVEEANAAVALYADAGEREGLELQKEEIGKKGKAIQDEVEAAQRSLTIREEGLSLFDQLRKVEDAFDVACVNVDEFAFEVATIEEAVAATSMDGPVLSKTLAAAAHVLSDGVITAKTTKESAKKTVPDFNVELTTEFGPIPYDQLSGGQLAAVDIYLAARLAKLIGGMDMLILDETLKFLNQEMVITLLDELKTSDIDKVVMIVHGKDTPQVTKVIEA